MKLRSFYSVLVSVVLVLLLAGGLGAVWLTAGSSPAAQPTQSARRQALTQPASAASALFISRQAAVVMSLLSNPEQLSEFWLTVPTAQRQRRQAELELLPQGLFAEFGLDYSRDLKSWLGNEATFAIMSADIDRDPATGLQPGYLLVLAMQNPQQAEEAVQAFWQRQAGEEQSEQVAGIPIFYADAVTGLASAIVGNRYVLFANDPKVLRTALNNAQVPELSLEKSFSYQQALEQLREPQAGFLFANLPELNPDLRRQLAQITQLDLAQYDSLMLGLRPASQGLLADAILLAATPSPSDPSDSIDASSLLHFIPTRSRFAIASRDLPQVWASAGQMGRPDWQQGLLALQQKLGLDLSETSLPESVLQGDFVLAQVPHSGRTDDWLLVVQQSAEMDGAVAQLDQLAQRQGMSLGSFQLADHTIYAWTKLQPSGVPGTVSLQAEVQGLRTQTGNYMLFATSLEALEQALSETGASLSASADFKVAMNQVAMDQLRPPNQGYLYLDRTALEQRLQPNPLLKTVLHGLQSALVTRYSAGGMGERAAAFLRLVD